MGGSTEANHCIDKSITHTTGPEKGETETDAYTESQRQTEKRKKKKEEAREIYNSVWTHTNRYF